MPCDVNGNSPKTTADHVYKTGTEMREELDDLRRNNGYEVERKRLAHVGKPRDERLAELRQMKKANGVAKAEKKAVVDDLSSRLETCARVILIAAREDDE